MYPVIRRKIYQTVVISDGEVNKALEEFALAMQALLQKIQHRPYLIGDHFGRADLTVASMLAFMAGNHPMPI